mgnify:FL=1
MMKTSFIGLLVFCCVWDALGMKLSECPPGYRCVKRTNRLRFARSNAAEPNDEYDAILCSPGTYSGGASEECLPCPTGTYAPIGGLPECIKCPTGHKCPDASAYPEQCPINTYTNKTKQICCRPCPAGEHAPVKGMGQCLPCPAGRQCNQSANLQCEDIDSKCAPFWKMPSADQGSYFTYPNANTRIRGDQSRSACVTFRALPADDSRILFSIGSSDTSCDDGRGCNKHFSLAIRNATHLDIYGMCYQFTNEAIRISQHSIYDGNFHQICVTYNNTDSNLCVYLDSKVSECIIRENPRYDTGLGDVRIGWWPDYNRQFEKNDGGLIHSLSLYDRVISESCFPH